MSWKAKKIRNLVDHWLIYNHWGVAVAETGNDPELLWKITKELRRCHARLVRLDPDYDRLLIPPDGTTVTDFFLEAINREGTQVADDRYREGLLGIVRFVADNDVRKRLARPQTIMDVMYDVQHGLNTPHPTG